MDLLLISVIAVIAVALIFDFTNGFHDAGNAVGTVVATRALPAKWAPAFSAFFNFVALFWMLIFGSAVADTIAKTVNTAETGVALAFAALFAAIIWNFVTWRLGLPSSSSHAIIGGLVGAGIAAGGFAAINGAAISKAAWGILLSPLVAFGIAFLAFFVIWAIQKIFTMRDNHPVFKGLQLVSAAGLSVGHGLNDAQKTMGVIAALLVGAGYATGVENVVAEHFWVALLAYSAIALGTLWGGWKIIETMGLKLTTLHANSGAAANIGASVSIFGATSLGMPISTTQAAASSIIGAGIGSGKGAHWRIIGQMFLAWILTIPAAAIVSFVIFHLTQLPTVLAWVSVGAVILAFGAWALWAMTHTITAEDVAAEIPADEILGEPVSAHPRMIDTDPTP